MKIITILTAIGMFLALGSNVYGQIKFGGKEKEEPLTSNQIKKLRSKFAESITLEVLFDSIVKRTNNNQDNSYFRLGSSPFSVRHALCVTFDRNGNRNDDKLCNDRMYNQNYIKVNSRIMIDAILKNSFDYVNGKDGPMLRFYVFERFMEWFHEYYSYKNEICPNVKEDKCYWEGHIKTKESLINRAIRENKDKPQIIDFAKQYGAFADRFHKERGEKHKIAITDRGKAKRSQQQKEEEERIRKKKAQEEETARRMRELGEADERKQLVRQEEQKRIIEQQRENLQIELVEGGPNRDFLAAQALSVTGNTPPVPVGAFVTQIVDALEGGKKKWKSTGKGQWLLTFNKKDQVTGKKLSMRVLFVKDPDPSGNYVVIARMIVNGREANKAEVLAIANQLAAAAQSKGR